MAVKGPDHDNPPESVFDSGFEGPVKKRKCTDLFWAIVFLFAWITAASIAIHAFNAGSYLRAVHPVDYNGRICGVGDLESKPDLYFIRVDGTGVCVETCPSTTDLNVAYACVDKADMPDYLWNTTDIVALYNNNYGFCMYQLATFNVHSYCIVTDPAFASKYTLSARFVSANYMMMQDIWTARWYIFGFGMASTLLFYWVMLLLHFGKAATWLVWNGIFIIFGLLVIAGVLGIYQGLNLVITPENAAYIAPHQKSLLFVTGIGSLLAGFIWIAWVIALRKHVHLATGLIGQITNCLGGMPSLFYLPLVQIAVWIITFTAYAFVTMTVSTIGTFPTVEGENDPLPHKVFHPDPGNDSKHFYLTFVLIWTTICVRGLFDLMVSIASTMWYFTRDKHGVKFGVACRASCTVICYHVGTAAIGAVAITLAEPTRMFFVWLDKQMRKCCTKICNEAMYCCFCFCCFFVEHWFRYWSKYAYAYTAIFSHRFSIAAQSSFLLIERNIHRVSVVTVLCDFIMVMLMLLSSLISTTACYHIMQNHQGAQLNNIFVPTCITFAIAFIVGSVSVDIVYMTTRTLIICFLADEEMFKPSERYVQDTFLDYMNQATSSCKPEIRES